LPIARQSLRTFPPAVPALLGDEIATSRGIFKLHFPASPNRLTALTTFSPLLHYRFTKKSSTKYL